jgi:hypothetical protein
MNPRDTLIDSGNESLIHLSLPERRTGGRVRLEYLGRRSGWTLDGREASEAEIRTEFPDLAPGCLYCALGAGCIHSVTRAARIARGGKP